MNRLSVARLYHRNPFRGDAINPAKTRYRFAVDPIVNQAKLRSSIERLQAPGVWNVVADHGSGKTTWMTTVQHQSMQQGRQVVYRRAVAKSPIGERAEERCQTSLHMDRHSQSRFTQPVRLVNELKSRWKWTTQIARTALQHTDALLLFDGFERAIGCSLLGGFLRWMAMRRRLTIVVTTHQPVAGLVRHPFERPSADLMNWFIEDRLDSLDTTPLVHASELLESIRARDMMQPRELFELAFDQYQMRLRMMPSNEAVQPTEVDGGHVHETFIETSDDLCLEGVR